MKLHLLGIRLAVFALVCALAGVLVVNTLRDPMPGGAATYHARFTDAEGLAPGSEVTVAGVRVGTVTDRRLVDGHAHVTFEVRTGQRVPADGVARIRYADLLGGRHLALTDGAGELAPGSTIPVERTRPALDLTALLGGFRPLFDAIDPAAVDSLATEIVAVFQGETSVNGLLRRVVSLTSTVTDRTDVLDATLSNLSSVLDTVNGRRDELRELIAGVGELTSFAADSRERIVAALDSGAGLADSLTRLLDDIRPSLDRDLATLETVTGAMADNEEVFAALLEDLPGFTRTLGRTLDYGSWVNVYVCALDIDVAGHDVDLPDGPNSEVCR